MSYHWRLALTGGLLPRSDLREFGLREAVPIAHHGPGMSQLHVNTEVYPNIRQESFRKLLQTPKATATSTTPTPRGSLLAGVTKSKGFVYTHPAEFIGLTD